MKRIISRGGTHPWVRFLIGGTINTGFTYLIYFGLHQFMMYQVAYFIAYGTGIIFAYWFNAKFVFRVPLSWKKLFTYPIVYIAQYLASTIFLGIIVEVFFINKSIAPLIVIAIMLPATYVMNKFFLGKNKKQLSR